MFKYFLQGNYFLNPEIVHFYDSENKDIILSECNKFYLSILFLDRNSKSIQV